MKKAMKAAGLILGIVIAVETIALNVKKLRSV